ncbi:FAD-dependent oxidoreductase [Planctomicrobium sp. SH664]|uniref:FAD-dependent oxidoreductase n=1 Tax=Planctomicrobium sp. SH664 TaxID=3448125 RepID=UPI003F5AE39F
MSQLPPVTTTCCIVGGGPAGMMLGFLLARAGVDVVVLEKHADFFRDFRGDTIHPSTLELMHELGLLEEFLKLPHQQYQRLTLSFEGRQLNGPDFSHLPTTCKFIAIMPQWDFLQFLATQGARYPTFHLGMSSTVTGLIMADGRVVGVRGESPDGAFSVQADLVVACDGRHSTVREQAGLAVKEFGVPLDVLWYRLPRPDGDRRDSLGWIRDGHVMVTIDRGEYMQCATLIPKGSFPAIQLAGLVAFQEQIGHVVPMLRGVVSTLQNWNQVKLLTVQINRLQNWARPGLLCIGDAAHAMSPAGGVGVNLAVQDAVAAANLLAARLREEGVRLQDLEAVQRRREFPVKFIQTLQTWIHRRMFRPGHPQKGVVIPRPARLLLGLAAPLLRRLAARLVGLGIRPEHIETPDLFAQSSSSPLSPVASRAPLR